MNLETIWINHLCNSKNDFKQMPGYKCLNFLVRIKKISDHILTHRIHITL